MPKEYFCVLGENSCVPAEHKNRRNSIGKLMHFAFKPFRHGTAILLPPWSRSRGENLPKSEWNAIETLPRPFKTPPRSLPQVALRHPLDATTKAPQEAQNTPKTLPSCPETPPRRSEPPTRQLQDAQERFFTH